MDLAKAIKAINTNASFQIDAEDSDNIIWLNGTTPISKADILAKQTELQAAYDALDYSRLRKAKYDLLNQDEMRYDDVKNSTTTWVDAIDTIKAAHPKP